MLRCSVRLMVELRDCGMERVAKVVDHVRYTSIDGEIVLLNIKTGKYLGLNAVASCMFQLLENGYEPEAIVMQLKRRYTASEAVLRHDLEKFLAEAAHCGIVVFSQ